MNCEEITKFVRLKIVKKLAAYAAYNGFYFICPHERGQIERMQYGLNTEAEHQIRVEAGVAAGGGAVVGHKPIVAGIGGIRRTQPPVDRRLKTTTENKVQSTT